MKTKVTYFENITTLEELKKQYRILAKENHPDKGGDENVMKAINNAYDVLTARILKGNFTTAEQFEYDWEASQLFKEKINSIINLPGIIVELVGQWIWVTGDTKTVKQTLKDSGYFFAPKKIAWYWRPAHLAGGRGKYSLEQLKNKYGSTSINGHSFKALAA